MIVLDSALAARVLTDPDTRRILAAFQGDGQVIADAARALHLPLETVRYRARRAVQAGVLVAVGRRTRCGRTQTVYRLPLPVFVPGLHVPGGPDTLLHPDEDAFLTQVRCVRAALLAGGGWGLRVTAGTPDLVAELARPEQQEATMDTLRDRRAPAVVDVSSTLHLSVEDAKALQAELLDVYARYAARQQPGQAHLLGLTLYPASP